MIDVFFIMQSIFAMPNYRYTEFSMYYITV